jgi:hypothetical protein
MKKEIESLNLTDIDVEELEHRVELGQMIPMVADATDVDQPFSCDRFLCSTFSAS